MPTALSTISPIQVPLSSLKAAATQAAPSRSSQSISLHQDAVKLSMTQQVRNLRAEGASLSQIESTLHLSPADVTGDLYVSVTWPQLLKSIATANTFGVPIGAGGDN